MELAARIGTMARRGAPLPYLRRVAYLESHGTEWIDTGVAASVDSIITVDIQLVSYINFGVYVSAIWGSADSTSSGFVIRERLQNECNAWNGTSSFGNHAVSDFERHAFSVSKSEFKIDDVVVSTLSSTPKVLQNTVKIFWDGGFIGQWIARKSKMKLFGHKHAVNGSAVCDVYPVLDLSGRPAMYDEVSGQLFYNQGTGEFAWGELDAASGAFSTGGGVLNA